MTILLMPAEAVHRETAAGDRLLIDVRTPGEFRSLHAQGAMSLPFAAQEAEDQARQLAGRPVALICATSARARRSAALLAAAGLADLVVVEGGTQAWVAAGLPVVRGRGAMSLERQVRIAAGTLVLLGAGLAWLVHPAWLALAGAVGLGLVVAGVTDTCGMAMLLARMPWNQRPGPSPAPRST
jgi:rhodanese-related sulfurtransferase